MSIGDMLQILCSPLLGSAAAGIINEDLFDNEMASIDGEMVHLSASLQALHMRHCGNLSVFPFHRKGHCETTCIALLQKLGFL